MKKEYIKKPVQYFDLVKFCRVNCSLTLQLQSLFKMQLLTRLSSEKVPITENPTSLTLQKDLQIC